MRFFRLVLFIPFLSTLLNAQITFSSFPLNNQLYPRAITSNTALVRISGTVTGADSLFFRVERTDGQASRIAFKVSDLSDNSFDQAFSIEALLQAYRFTVELSTPDSTWVAATAQNIVAGDVLLVQGQSNAQAAGYNGDANVWQSNYVRCFGDSNPQNFQDGQWYIAEGNGYFTPGAIGQWALRMGSLLQEQFQIPIAVINGADPGKPIEYFQRNDALPEDPATNYGRLLQRLDNAGLTGHIRAILYYQGESDSERADVHKSLFEALYADWSADFPGVEAYCVVQVREGCLAPSLQLREYQRQFEDYLPKLTTMTVNGIPGHDGCHYNVVGYGQLGEKMYAQLAGDLYATPSVEQLNVRVLNARFTNNNNTRITLTTDAVGLLAQPGSFADFKFEGTSNAIIQLSVQQNQIILDLESPVYEDNAGISYAGHSGDVNGWVLNSDGYGLFSFFNLPIENHTPLPNFDNPGIMSGSGNCLAFDGTDDRVYIGPLLQASYTKEAWINWQGGGVANNIISGVINTALWVPLNGGEYHLASGHNGGWFQVYDPAPLKPHEWVHVAVTYDAGLGEIRLYKNGNLIGMAQGVPPHNDPELFIGAYAGANNFQGKIDEVRIWNTPRSIEEIRAFMCRKLAGDEPGLSGYFRLDQTEGNAAINAANGQIAPLLGYQTPGWRRSAAPIGTKSTYTYQNTGLLSLGLSSGDSLVLSALNVPEFVHLYFTEEVPNVLQPAAGHVLVDNTRYFGLFYPDNSIEAYTLTCHYTGNPFANVDEPRLRLLQRRNNAQPFWEQPDSLLPDYNANFITLIGNDYHEYILAIQENTVDASEINKPAGGVYPNPTSGMLYFNDLEMGSLTLVDTYGNLCLTQTGPSRTLDMSMLPPGLYFLTWTDTDARMYQQKIVLLNRR